MTPPTSTDGTDISGATIDGTDVTEITIDGQTVFLQGAFDITKVTFEKSVPVSEPIGNEENPDPQDIAWNNDGTRLYELHEANRGSDGRRVFQLDLSTPFDIATLSPSGNKATRRQRPVGIEWNNDGSRFYEMETYNDSIQEFTCSTPFDITTKSYNTFKETSVDAPVGMAWGNDGFRLYEIGDYNLEIHQLNLSNPFDLSTASFSASINTQDAYPSGIAISNDGLKLYETGNEEDPKQIYQYTLSTPFELSTASFSTSIDAQGRSLEAIVWDNSGSRLYELSSSFTKEIYQSSL